MSTPGTPTSGSKAIPKWKQLQIEQQELAAKRKREEAEAKAKKLQESGLFVVPRCDSVSGCRCSPVGFVFVGIRACIGLLCAIEPIHATALIELYYF
jgi:hypothetical protein